MKPRLLITAGCSWVFGCGVGYQPGMNKQEYSAIAFNTEICDSLSFRGLISKKYNFKNINFAESSSSNQKQFRLIKNFFSSDAGKRMFDEFSDIVVLHGITSTARNELYVEDEKSLVNFHYHFDSKWIKPYVKNFYNHNNEVARLAEEMNFLNQFYQHAGIKNIWVDTFNHHNYPVRINNLLGMDKSNYRDLLSTMALLSGMTDIDTQYHTSTWDIDTNRSKFLVDNGYLNPISLHPTEKGHELIVDIIKPQLENLI